MPGLKVVMAQTNPLVGAISRNTEQIITLSKQARDEYSADVLVFPELSITGYPPEDLLLRPSLAGRVERALQQIKAAVTGIYVVVGYPRQHGSALFNAAGVIYNGDIIAEYHKHELPNYRVFDEKRYFTAGSEPAVVDIGGCRVGLTICEDIWQEGPVGKAKVAGADCVININASPYYIGKQTIREDVVLKRAREHQLPILYVHMVGGQDELVYDGGSFAANPDGLAMRAPNYDEGLFEVALSKSSAGSWRWQEGDKAALLERLPEVYNALVLGVRDYVNKNGFKNVILGLSGGIDSALTLTVAADALGAERVAAVMMPFRYTSQISKDDAEEEASNLGVKYSVIPIEPMYTAFMSALEPEFEGYEPDTTEENLQARCRGVVLMAISNKTGALVLTTGNKSEMAVGYSTLYGDMAGGFDVLKDVPKMLVYELSRYRNTIAPVIPQRVIDRAPSAELAPDQTDQDNLPAYHILDAILELYVEQDQSATAIAAQGFDEAVVRRVIRLVDLNEYKRRQAPIGVRITQRGFGRDRRYPITSGWEIGD